jgi:hypothetical protein
VNATPLMYLSERTERELREGVSGNLRRYLTGDFSEFADTRDWTIPLSIVADLEPLTNLKAGDGADIEVFNSLLVWKSLSGLTPSLANEGRIWTRLTHLEGLEFARQRWIGDLVGPRAEKAIAAHFFGVTRTARRDDNAIGRLWWNAYIARQAMPGRHHEALKALLGRADIRLNVVERPWYSTRPKVAAAIVRTLVRMPALAASEQGFREFMKALNRRGGGVLFEVMSDGDIDVFFDACV